MAVTHAGTTFTTTGGNTTVVATPAVGDLIIVIAATTGVAGGTTAVSDNQTPAGVYDKINTDFTGFSTTGVLNAWVRTAFITAASSTTWTATQASSTGGGLTVIRISGQTSAGIGSIRGCGGQSSIASGTPAPVLLRRIANVYSGTQGALTTNVIIGAVCCGTNSTTNFLPRSSPAYTEDFDNGYNAPATGLEVMHIASGDTASTITWGSAVPSTSASIAIEVDTSVPQYDWVTKGIDSDRELWRQGAVGTRAHNWQFCYNNYMKISENRESPFEAKEAALRCPDCGKMAIVIFPYKPSAQQRIETFKAALDEHRKICTAAPPEKERVYEIWYPRKQIGRIAFKTLVLEAYQWLSIGVTFIFGKQY